MIAGPRLLVPLRCIAIVVTLAVGLCNVRVAASGLENDAGSAGDVTLVEREQGLADRGWHERAVRLLADALEANPTAREPRLALGALLAEMQRPADAREVLTPMLDRADGSTDRDALVHLAVAWAGTDNGDQLAALLEDRCGFIDASSSPGLKALAELARGRYAAAVERAESALKEDVAHPGEGVLLRIVAARACERLGRFDAAQGHLRSLAMQRPGRPLAFDLLVRLHLRQPHDIDADGGFDGLEQMSPCLTALARASLLTRERKLASAEATLRDALRRAVDAKLPAAVELAHALAEVRFERGEPTAPAFSPLVRAKWLPATAILGAIEWRERERDRPLSSGWHHRVAEHATGDEPAVHQRIAERLWRMGEPEAAIAGMRKALHTKGNDASGARRLAAMLESRGRVAEAIDVLESAIASHPDHAGLALQRAETLDRAGELPAAERAYRRAMNLDPVTRIRAALRLQELFERAGVASEAMLVLDDAAAMAASRTASLPLSLYAALHERRGRVALGMGLIGEAERSWRSATGHPAYRGASRVGLIRIALLRKDREAALRLTDELVRQHAEDAIALLNLPGHLEDASAIFARADAALNLNDLALADARRWLRHRFERLGQEGRWDEARETLARWMELDDTSDEAASLYAAMLAGWGDGEAARGVVRRAGLSRPDHPDALTLAAGLERRGGRAEGELAPLLLAVVEGHADRARASLRTMPHALTLHRHDVHAMLDVIDITDPVHAAAARRLAAAVVALELGQPRLAAAIAQRVAEAHRRFTLAHALWAQGCWAARDGLDAVASAVEHDAPDSVLADVVQALQARERGEPERARDALARALRLEPANAHLTYHLAEAEAQAGDVGGAIRRLAHLRSRSALYRRKAAEGLIELTLQHRPERYAAMVEWIEKACGDSPAPGVLAAAGRAAWSAGDHERGRRWLERAISLGERDAATHLALAQLYEKQRQRAWALRHLDAAIRDASSGEAFARARDMRERLTQTAEVATD